VVQVAHQAGKWVGICGELGGMPLALPALIGLGVDELSMNSQSLAEAVYRTRSLTFDKAKALADEVLKQSDSKEIQRILKEGD
jgi:phosphotransferase system enzyme I (PtsI)